jgi:hypothetical protein
MTAKLPFRDFSVSAPLTLVLLFGLLVRNTHRLPVVEDARFVVLILLVLTGVAADWGRCRAQRIATRR